MSTLTLFGVVALLGVNQVVMRVPWLLERALVFYGLLLIQIAAGTAVIALGLPGFEHAPAIRWVIGLVFFLHVAQDLSVRQKRLRAVDDARSQERRERADELRERVRDE